ncbi:MAG TPA: beta-ketoacyl synthase chain length factor [Steroidobacteraceae bacterium]|nr:beta-ketoacyl synthase chain length factor [Steroidobacteraceae bacterium]
MVKLAAHIEGIGLLGPGLDGWTGSVALLECRSPYIRQPTVVPIPDGLPPAERRRIGLVVKLALGVGLQAISKAGVEPDALPAVFASSGGDGENCHEICQALSHDERMISPTRFHNSVHNAAAGYWSIATRSKAASNALCAFDWSFAAGLLEAVTQVAVDQTRVLLVAYDSPYPQPLYAKRPIPGPFGVAFVLAPVSAAPPAQAGAGGSVGSHDGASPAPHAGVGSIARLTVQLGDSPADRMSNTDLESLRASIPAARSLPLLHLLAVRKNGVVNIEYLDGRSLAVEVETCA